MATIRPFNALRRPPTMPQKVAAVPYDVVNTKEARALASGNPFSFLHVSRPEIDLPDGTPIYGDEFTLRLPIILRSSKKMPVTDRRDAQPLSLSIDHG